MIAVHVGLGHTRYIRDVKEHEQRNQYNNPIIAESDIIEFIQSTPTAVALLRDVAQRFDLSEPYTNTVLKRMTEEGLICRTRQGGRMLYSVT